MAMASVGTDTGGSVRIPAAVCGLVGLKPGYGELPMDGGIPLSRTLDHAGPLARTVTDTWHMLHALRERTPVKTLVPSPAERLRLGVPRRYFLDLLDDAVGGAFERAVAVLRDSGATIVDADIAHADLIGPVYTHIVFGDAAAYHGLTLDRAASGYTPNVRLRLETARYVMAEDYVRALDGRRVLQREVDAALTGCDALLLPTVPITAPAIGASMVRVGSAEQPVRNVMLRLTQLFNLTGHPAVTVPCPPASRSDLPTGIQLVGALGQTDQLLHIAGGVEATLSPGRADP
jgi:aspartyl-tRNA(Asn)/glutamyl-tRNA(Gln) amidotransferase subunit A